MYVAVKMIVSYACALIVKIYVFFFIKHASSKSGEDGDGTCIVGKRSRYEKQAMTPF